MPRRKHPYRSSSYITAHVKYLCRTFIISNFVLNKTKEQMKDFLFRTLFPKKALELKQEKEAKEETLRHNYENGYHLKEEVFLPQELGFNMTQHFDDAIGYVDIYTKEGYQLIPDFKSDERGYYSLKMPNGSQFVVKITNSYDAIMILSALGMKVSLETIMGDTSIIDKIDNVLR